MWFVIDMEREVSGVFYRCRCLLSVAWRGVAWRVAWRGVSLWCGCLCCIAVVCGAVRLFAVRCGAVVVSVGDGDVMCVCMYRCVG